MLLVKRHNDRLKRGFAGALTASMPSIDEGKASNLAEVLVIFTNGLWTLSRSVSSADPLRRAVRNFLHLLSDNTK